MSTVYLRVQLVLSQLYLSYTYEACPCTGLAEQLLIHNCKHLNQAEQQTEYSMIIDVF